MKLGLLFQVVKQAPAFTTILDTILVYENIPKIFSFPGCYNVVQGALKTHGASEKGSEKSNMATMGTGSISAKY
jgi:hypothetical protein